MKPLFFLFIGFLVMILITYGSLVYLKSEKEKLLAEMVLNDSTIVVEKSLSETDSLSKTDDKNKIVVTRKEEKMDSTKTEVVENVEAAKKKPRDTFPEYSGNSLFEISGKTAKLQAVAKTFEKMSVKQIAPILKNLDDNTLLQIYTNTGSRYKKNILLAINEKRAALITKEFINEN